MCGGISKAGKARSAERGEEGKERVGQRSEQHTSPAWASAPWDSHSTPNTSAGLAQRRPSRPIPYTLNPKPVQAGHGRGLQGSLSRECPKQRPGGGHRTLWLHSKPGAPVRVRTCAWHFRCVESARVCTQTISHTLTHSLTHAGTYVVRAREHK